tara:strand:- start:12383 stop:12601 length:219 start_codon:yes stop_codon:yes gene_type:complete
MAIPKKQKPTKKDLVYNIALLRQEMFRVTEKFMLLESVIYKYIEMKKDTDNFNKYLQNELENRENEEEAKNS